MKDDVDNIGATPAHHWVTWWAGRWRPFKEAGEWGAEVYAGNSLQLLWQQEQKWRSGCVDARFSSSWMFGGLSRDQCLGFEEKASPLPLSHSLARHRGEKKREMRTVHRERPRLWNSSIGDAVSQIRTGNKVSPGRRAHWCPPDWQADPRPSQVLGRECHNWLWCHICIFSQLIYTISFDFTNSRRRRICLVKCTTTYHNICKCMV